MAVKNPIQPGDGDPRHGTPHAYTNHGCHCDLCTEAHTVKHREYMHRTPEQRKAHRNRENRRSREKQA